VRQKCVIQNLIFLVATEVLSKAWFFWLREKYVIQSVIILVATEVCYPKRDFFGCDISMLSKAWFFGCDTSMLSKAWFFWLRHKYAIQSVIFWLRHKYVIQSPWSFVCLRNSHLYFSTCLPCLLGLSYTYVLVNLSNSELINTHLNVVMP
jgi:hypothetical protein